MITTRRLADDQLSVIQPLFEQVFRHSASAALLDWKYGNGRGASWTAWWNDVDLVLHCGLCFRDVLCAGAPVRAAQLVDLMAPPKQSGLSRQQSPFTALMHRILDSLPNHGNPDGIAFGFPSDRAMRLGEHAGVYCAVDEWLELEFTPRNRVFGPSFELLDIHDPATASLVNTLWSRMRVDFEPFILGVRDDLYLSHRYLSHPEKKYIILLVRSRWRRAALGLVVVAPNAPHPEILDLIGAWNDMPELILAAQYWLHECGGERLALMLTGQFARQLAPFANRCSKTQFRIMANPKTPQPVRQMLQNRWWLTGGDTDYR